MPLRPHPRGEGRRRDCGKGSLDESMKSVMSIAKEEERKEFLELSPLERMEAMHNLMLQFIALKAGAEGVSKYEIYTRYLKNNPRHYERSAR